VIRWDARTTTIVPIEPLDVDEEDARVDLGHRYRAWFGAAGGAERFARWAGIDLADAAATWRRLDAEPTSPRRGVARGVRFLPFGDPYLYGRPPPRTAARELPGAVLVDGRRAATWARRAHHVTVTMSSQPSAERLARVERAAAELSGPVGRPVRVTIRLGG
jgi:hypothetical protein